MVGYLQANHAAGVSSLTRFAGKFSKPGSTALRYSRAGTCCLRHVSTIEMMAATRGPACSLPTWIQFLRPMAAGRIEFSVALLLSSSSGWSRKRVSRFHSLSVYSRALVLILWGKPSSTLPACRIAIDRPDGFLPRPSCICTGTGVSSAWI